MSLDLNIVRGLIDDPDAGSKIDPQLAYVYIKNTLEQLHLSKSTNVDGKTECDDKCGNTLATICLSLKIPATSALMVNIAFIRVATRNSVFVEKFFTANRSNDANNDSLQLFEIFLNHYKKLVDLNARKNNYLCEMAKVISNTIIQTKNLPTNSNFRTVAFAVEQLVEPTVKWLHYQCKFDHNTCGCMYHHFRWLFLACNYTDCAKKTPLASPSYSLVWYEKMYDFLDSYTRFKEYSQDRVETNSNLAGQNQNQNSDKLTNSDCTEEKIKFCSQVLFPCANTLFNISYSLPDHSLDYHPLKGGQLSSIFYKYFGLIGKLFENFDQTHTLYENVVVLLCNFASCLSCADGAIFDVFSETTESDPIVSKLNALSQSLHPKEINRAKFSTTFEKYNVSKVVFLMETLQNLALCVLNFHNVQSTPKSPSNVVTHNPLAADKERSGDLIKLLMGIIALCKYSNKFRRYVRFQTLPPLQAANVQIRPEQEQSLRGYLTRLLTTTNINLNMVVGEFIYVLCRENVNRLVKYVGMGNAMGYLHHRGLLAPPSNTPASYNELSSDNSDIEDFEIVADEIDPITGAISKHQSAIEPHSNEEQLNSLVENIRNLQQLDIITTANISNDGKITKSTFPLPKQQ